jgi:hypothetical protein
MKKMKNKYVHLFEEFNQKHIINNIEEFRDFIDSYSNEILSNVYGESDGWNQKITAINKILDDNNIEISSDIYDDEEYDEIINSI